MDRGVEVTPLVSSHIAELEELGEAGYDTFNTWIKQYGTPNPWSRLSLLSAYAAGVEATAIPGLGLTTPRLEPFMFVSTPRGVVPYQENTPMVAEKLLRSSSLALAALYEYMARRAEIVVPYFGDNQKNTVSSFINSQIIAGRSLPNEHAYNH